MRSRRTHELTLKQLQQMAAGVPDRGHRGGRTNTRGCGCSPLEDGRLSPEQLVGAAASWHWGPAIAANGVRPSSGARLTSATAGRAVRPSGVDRLRAATRKQHVGVPNDLPLWTPSGSISDPSGPITLVSAPEGPGGVGQGLGWISNGPPSQHHGGAGGAPKKAQKLNLPLGWSFCAGNPGLGIDHYPPSNPGAQHDIDGLVDTNGEGFDVGTFLDEYSRCPSDIQQLFDIWTESTSVPEHGGVPYGCPGAFPCGPWRTMEFELPRGNPPCDDNKLGICPMCTDLPCSPGPWTELRIAPAHLQWLWICARLESNTGPLLQAGFEVAVDNGVKVVVGFQSTVATLDSDDFYGVVASVRCRQVQPNSPLRIYIRRIDVRGIAADAFEACDLGIVHAKVLGRIGHVIP